MSRVKRGNKRVLKRRRILKEAKGFYGTKSKAHRIAKLAVEKAGLSAFRDRRKKKRDFRSLWIVRINAAARAHGLSYSRLIAGLEASGSNLNRKSLAELAVHDPAAFEAVVQSAAKALASA